jgi:hypothetical protein
MVQLHTFVLSLLDGTNPESKRKHCIASRAVAVLAAKQQFNAIHWQ